MHISAGSHGAADRLQELRQNQLLASQIASGTTGTAGGDPVPSLVGGEGTDPAVAAPGGSAADPGQKLSSSSLGTLLGAQEISGPTPASQASAASSYSDLQNLLAGLQGPS